MKTTKIRLKRSVVSALKLLLGLILLMISIYFLVLGSNNNIKKQKVLTSMNEINNIDYQVYLKDNSYFTVPYLPKGERYIASLIDKIHVTYTHQLKSTEKIDTVYQYRVVGTLSALEKKEEGAYHKIWNKQYAISTEKELKIVNSKQLEVTDNFDIDYEYYKKLAQEFKNEYGLAMDASLNIKVYLDMNGSLVGSENQIQNSTILELDIPLEDETIDIKTIYSKSNNREIVEENDTKFVKNTPLFVIGCFTFAASVAVVASFLIELISNSKKQFSFEKEKKKILNKYDNDIVNASRVPNMNGMNIIEVTTFQELMDAKEELKVPIIYVEVIPGISGWFMIMKDNQVWRYRLEGATKK